MKKATILFLILVMFSGCAVSWQLGIPNPDPVYSIEGSDTEVKVIKNEFELARLLRNDFNFRYDFAQYALSQPESFDWRFNRMNRSIGFNRYNRYNRYNRFNSYMGYSYSPWNRSQMWNDWVWGYPYSNGIGWSYSWNNNRWSSNSWNGWGNGYGYNAWHQIYGRQQNVANVSGRRMSLSDRQGFAAMGNSRIATTVKNNRVLNNNIRIIPKPVNTAIKNVVKIKRPIRNNIPVYNNPNRVIKNNNIPVIRNNNNNNTRTVIPRNTRTVVIKSTSTTQRLNSRRKN